MYIYKHIIFLFIFFSQICGSVRKRGRPIVWPFVYATYCRHEHTMIRITMRPKYYMYIYNTLLYYIYMWFLGIRIFDLVSCSSTRCASKDINHTRFIWGRIGLRSCLCRRNGEYIIYVLYIYSDHTGSR